MPRIPKLRTHFRGNSCFVQWQGKRHRIEGKPGSTEAERNYQQFLARHVHDIERFSGEPVTVSVLTYHFLREMLSRRGAADKEYQNHAACAPFLLKHASSTLCSQFGPRLLRRVREEMVAHRPTKGPRKGSRWSRQHINRQVNRIRRIFRWGVAEELVPAERIVALKALEPLRKGDTEAPDTDERVAVELAAVEATVKHLPPMVADMVWLQWHTGARPGEVCSMAWEHVDTSDETLWLWKPVDHKNAWRGLERVIPIGPQAIERLAPQFKESGWVFSPREVMAWRQQKRAEQRKTKVQPSQEKRKAERKRRRKLRAPGEVYTTQSYGRAIKAACAKAGIPPWTPNQLRHAKGMRTQERFGTATVRAILGHKSLKATQTYAKPNLELARRAAREDG